MAITPQNFVKSKKLHIGICGGQDQSQSLRQMRDNIRAMGAIPHTMIDHGTYSCSDHIMNDAKQDMSMMDAVIIMGNNADLDPASYGQLAHPATFSETVEAGGRDRRCYEEAVIKEAMATKMPLLAICGGMQRVNVVQGGSLHQHIPDLLGGSRHHEQITQREEAQLEDEQTLSINGDYRVEVGSAIGQRLTQHELRDVCAHHQSVDRLGEGLRMSVAHAFDRVPGADGNPVPLIEGIETDPDGPLAGWPMMGFQFHPEFNRSPVGAAALDWLAEQAVRYQSHHPTPHARASFVPPAEPGHAQPTIR